MLDGLRDRSEPIRPALFAAFSLASGELECGRFERAQEEAGQLPLATRILLCWWRARRQ